ncbi:hypothetical protein Q3G72_029141 [Acer saccharum]|nr:hypothetical protein Q3G72_029141 [Acer saccharum]
MDSDFHESHAALSSRSRVPSQPSLNTFGELLHSVSVGNAVGHEDRLLLNNALNNHGIPNGVPNVHDLNGAIKVDLHAPPRSSSEALNSLPNDAIKDVNSAITKSFAKTLQSSPVASIPSSEVVIHSKKGGYIVVQIDTVAYNSRLSLCKHSLINRLILSKGDIPWKHDELKVRLQSVWK